MSKAWCLHAWAAGVCLESVIFVVARLQALSGSRSDKWLPVAVRSPRRLGLHPCFAVGSCERDCSLESRLHHYTRLLASQLLDICLHCQASISMDRHCKALSSDFASSDTYA